MNLYMVKYGTSLNKETLGQLTTSLIVVQSEAEFQVKYREGFNRISRQTWRQLKREQKEKAKQLSHDLMFEQVKRLMG